MIDTQAIRSKILDLAMRGQLTEQLPEDGTVEVPREILAAKNAKSAKEYSRRDAESAENATPPFTIPSNWKWVRLGSVSVIVRGSGIKRNETSESGVQCVRYGEIYTDYGYSFSRSVSHVPVEIADKCQEATFGDVLCTLTGENEIEIAKATAYLGKERLVIGGDLAKITNHPYDPMLLVYFLFSPFLINQKASVCSDGMIVHMGKSALANLMVPLPPLAEQHRIVARVEQAFSALDTIDALQAKYADNLAVLKSKLIDAAIQGKLTEQLPEDGTADELYRQIQAEKQALIKAGKIKKEKPLPEITADEIPFEIPEEWKWTRLGNLMLVVSTGPFGSMLHESDYCEGGIPLVNPMHIQNGAIHPSDKMRVSASTLKRLSQYRLSEGMIVVARRGDLGRCASVGKTENGWICGTGCFFLNPSRHVFVPFITLVISSPFARSVFRGTAIGTTMANLNHNLLKGLPFPLPPLAEQKRIVKRLDEVLKLVEARQSVAGRAAV